VSRLAPSRVVVALALAALVGTTTACQDDPAPAPKQYTAPDKSICDAPILHTEYQHETGRRLTWVIKEANPYGKDGHSVSCNATTSSVWPGSALSTIVNGYELQVRTSGGASYTGSPVDGSFGDYSDVALASDHTSALPDGWWFKGTAHTGTWANLIDADHRKPTYQMTTIGQVTDGNILVAITLVYPGIPANQMAAYTKKSHDLAYRVLNGLGPELHTE